MIEGMDTIWSPYAGVLDIIGMDVHSYDDVHTVFCNIEIAISTACGDIAPCQMKFPDEQ